jgi:hypothetical protein
MFHVRVLKDFMSKEETGFNGNLSLSENVPCHKKITERTHPAMKIRAFWDTVPCSARVY